MSDWLTRHNTEYEMYRKQDALEHHLSDVTLKTAALHGLSSWMSLVPNRRKYHMIGLRQPPQYPDFGGMQLRLHAREGSRTVSGGRYQLPLRGGRT